MNIPEYLTISIASKDRPEVVEATLRKIHAFGLGDCPLILCDDGSSPPLNLPALALFPKGKLLRNEVAEGQALARNRIAKQCATPYLLQLDDDSYPVAGSLEKLIEAVEREDNWLAVAIPFEEPARGRGFPDKVDPGSAIELSAFVGCSVLLHVERFNRLGGYAKWVGRMVEEDELCVRSFLQGMRVIQLNDLKIRHEVTSVARSNKAICYLSFRNWTVTWLRYTPLILILWSIVRLGGLALLDLLRNRRVEAVTGLLVGLYVFARIPSYDKRMSLKSYCRFRAMPHALSFFVR